ncbi:putative immunity protein [Ramlibacter sp. AN1133]|uniref:putative immunity protein n=1 Tax=Ramlibacter sp. AN1133 TaxID=3133429 RepID=UPI0030C19B27
MNEELDALAAAVRLMDDESADLRLAFGLACARRVVHLLEDPRAVAAVGVLQAFVEGRCDASTFLAARREVEAVARSHPGSRSLDGAAHAAVSATNAVANALAGRALDAAGYGAYAAVYAYSGSAVMDRSAFEGEFRWQVEELARLAGARLIPPSASSRRPFGP